MICAEDELGIGTGHEGIMVLPQEAVPGTPAAAFLGLESDTVIEIGLTPNRADAMSHYGVARDLAAFLKAHGRRGSPCPVRRVSTTGDCLRRRLPWSVRRGPRAMPAW